MIEKIKHLGFPTLFVILYGSGFVGAKYALPYSSALSFLSLRFFIAGLILLSIAMILKVTIPKLIDIIHISIAGIFTVSIFSIGVFISIDMGLSPALSAIIIALQPILVAIFAKSFIDEEITLLQWGGLSLGLIGVILVVFHNVDFSKASLYSVLFSILGLVGLTFGNIYQKKFCSDMNIFVGGSIQSISSALVCFILLILFKSYHVEWTLEFFYALSFMTIGVSIGALSLLYIMIKRAEVSKVASIFYLVPVSAAISGYLIYDERFDLVTILGVFIVAIGVYLTNKNK